MDEFTTLLNEYLVCTVAEISSVSSYFVTSTRYQLLFHYTKTLGYKKMSFASMTVTLISRNPSYVIGLRLI